MWPWSSISLAALTAWSPGLRQAGRRTLRAAIEGREADVMVEAKGTRLLRWEWRSGNIGV